MRLSLQKPGWLTCSFSDTRGRLFASHLVHALEAQCTSASLFAHSVARSAPLVVGFTSFPGPSNKGVEQTTPRGKAKEVETAVAASVRRRLWSFSSRPVGLFLPLDVRTYYTTKPYNSLPCNIKGTLATPFSRYLYLSLIPLQPLRME